MPMLALGLLAVSALGGTVYQVSAQSNNKNPVSVVQKIGSSSTQGEVDENGTETNDDNEVVSPSILAQVKITELQARQIALAANPATTIKTIIVSDEDGKAVYEIKLSSNTEVTIDAVTGSILKEDNEDGDTIDQKDAHGNDVEKNDSPDQKD